MKIKLYIVTYNSDNVLRTSLDNLFKSDIKNYNYEVFIINNYGILNDSFEDDFKLKVLNNALRPDFSTGHLSRNWNQAIVNGFKSIINPDCDLLIAMQNDTLVCSDFVNKLIKHHNKYSFITAGRGDNLMSFKIEAIKNVGLFDERFCNIGYQEADYFLRQVIFNKNSCSINDSFHGRSYNEISDSIIDDSFSSNSENRGHHIKSQAYHQYTNKLFLKKWNNFYPERWNGNFPIKPQIESYMYYPYFEKDIATLKEQGYLI